MKRNVAIVALRNEREEVFLVRTKKYPHAWQPIGGGIEEGDQDAIAAVIRETKEEAGIDIVQNEIQEVIKVPFDFGEGTVHCFTATIKEDIKLQINEEEIVEARWFNLQEGEGLPAYPATKTFLKELRKKK